uniref:Putative ovule protein n=1 Tax=Solanum chacoense TaxID=4108 RepID=A0A0V0IVB8_SOLCH
MFHQLQLITLAEFPATQLYNYKDNQQKHFIHNTNHSMMDQDSQISHESFSNPYKLAINSAIP